MSVRRPDAHASSVPVTKGPDREAKRETNAPVDSGMHCFRMAVMLGAGYWRPVREGLLSTALFFVSHHVLTI